MLSDGVRSLALIAAQIAWRAATLNPHRGDRAAIDAEGVVLIDEVCLGLHPKWQRLVIQSLTKAFPKIQFVATTHSPQVLGSAKDARVILLQSGSAQPLMGLYGKDTNTLVTVYQGGEERDSRVQADLSAVEKLIDDDQVDQAQTRIADVERLLGADDPAIVRLRTLIRFLRPPKDGEAV
jgi:predicted ATP-binding protein involved in virulence